MHFRYCRIDTASDTFVSDQLAISFGSALQPQASTLRLRTSPLSPRTARPLRRSRLTSRPSSPLFPVPMVPSSRPSSPTPPSAVLTELRVSSSSSLAARARPTLSPSKYQSQLQQQSPQQVHWHNTAIMRERTGSSARRSRSRMNARSRIRRSHRQPAIDSKQLNEGRLLHSSTAFDCAQSPSNDAGRCKERF